VGSGRVEEFVFATQKAWIENVDICKIDVVSDGKDTEYNLIHPFFHQTNGMTSVIRKLWIVVNLYMKRALYVLQKQFHEVSYANVGREVLNSQSTIISAQIAYQLHLSY
jgi:hypothetical protein